jgi:hypothetical protein
MKLNFTYALLLNLMCVAVAFMAGGMTSINFINPTVEGTWKAGAFTAWAFLAIIVFTYLVYTKGKMIQED